MKSKKGFTLIELLAVIAILAILLILAIPNVIKMFNKAKVNSFVTEAQSIINTAEKQYMSDQLGNGNPTMYYCYDGTGEAENKLNLSGNDKTKYYIKMVDGKIITVNISNDNYSVLRLGDDIITGDISNDIVKSNDYMPVTCEGGTDREISTSTACFNYQIENNEVTITGYYDYENGNDQVQNKECPRDVVIPSKIENSVVTTIGDSSFRNTGLTSLVISPTITTIKDNGFSDNNLGSVIIPNSVTTIGNYAFWQSKITNVSISKNIKKINLGTFAYNDLTSVTIPTGVTEIGMDAFYRNKLSSVTIPTSVTLIDKYAFEYNQLKNIEIPNSVQTINDWAFADNELIEASISSNLEIINRYAFAYNKLKSITIPYGVKEIKSYAFYHNDLSSVIISQSVNTIGDSAFNDNELTSVTIPDSVTSIGNAAFYYNKLTSVTIPDSVTSIGDSAFINNKLTSVCIEVKRGFNNFNPVITNSPFGWENGYSDSNIVWNCNSEEKGKKFKAAIEVKNGISDSSEILVEKYSSGTFNITPNSGYSLSAAKITGCDNAIYENGKLTLTNILSDQLCKVELMPISNSLADLIKNNNNILTTTPSLSSTSFQAKEHNMYVTSTDLGDTYYFRGGNWCELSDGSTSNTISVEQYCKDNNGKWKSINNNLRFAGYDWKIVRINEDGTIRLIKNDSIGSSSFDNSTSSYTSGMFYSTSGPVGTALNNFYNTKLNEYDDQIAEINFQRVCVNDTGNSWCYLNKSSYSPEFLTPNTFDYLNITWLPGERGGFTSKIGLITMEEVIYAGLNTNSNNTNYLVNSSNSTAWTLSPAGMSKAWYSQVYYFSSSLSSLDSRYSADIRPVINLKSDVIGAGEGSIDIPYVLN